MAENRWYLVLISRIYIVVHIGVFKLTRLASIPAPAMNLPGIIVVNVQLKVFIEKKC